MEDQRYFFVLLCYKFLFIVKANFIWKEMWWNSTTVLVLENLKQKWAVPFHIEDQIWSILPWCHHSLSRYKTCSKCWKQYSYLGTKFRSHRDGSFRVILSLILSWRYDVISHVTQLTLTYPRKASHIWGTTKENISAMILSKRKSKKFCLTDYSKINSKTYFSKQLFLWKFEENAER